MSDNTTASDTSMSSERFNHFIAVLIAVVTLLGAIIAYLQSDASARDDQANRDTRRYATEAFGRKVSGDARVNYDYNTAYQSWYEFDLLASSAETRGDEATAKRYTTMRDNVIKLSPLLTAPYFDPATGNVDTARYEADIYLVEITALQEKFAAASSVKDAWDGKANTYIVHITLLAVALFLLGLSTTISGTATRWIFSGAGVLIAIVATAWAAITWAQPVDDLRTHGGAIDAYAKGVGLAHQEHWKEAVASFDEALKASPEYINAIVERADAHTELGDLQAAAGGYEKARAVGDQRAYVAGNLAWTYYQLGRLEDAIAMNRTALASTPDELWIHFDLALAQLAAGKIDEGKASYTAGIDSAARQVAEAHAAKQEPPYDLWWGLDTAAQDLDALLEVFDSGQGIPPRNTISNPEGIRPVAQELISQLKSSAIALEYTGKLPAGKLSATISPFVFGIPDAEGEVAEPAETFGNDTKEIAVLFDYENMQDGKPYVFKVYYNGEEDPSWRLIDDWSLGASGSAIKSLSPGYSETFVFAPGFYEVELFVDSQLAQRGSFVVEE